MPLDVGKNGIGFTLRLAEDATQQVNDELTRSIFVAVQHKLGRQVGDLSLIEYPLTQPVVDMNK